VRRFSPDRTQIVRRTAQAAFAALNLLLGIEFYRFVLQFEPGGRIVGISRPAGVEGWLPIAGLMNLKYALLTGKIPEVHPAAMFLLAAFLLISFLFRKSFCSWLCPVGTLSEALWKLGRGLFRRTWALPRWADLPLRGLKYLLLGFFLYAVAGMSVETIAAFFTGPYGLVADVKMLSFFRHLGRTAAVTLAILGVLSMVAQNFWCRYLCPYGALLGIASLLSPSKIRRFENRCVDCAKCARACPSLLPVDKLVTIQSAECTACLECVAACPAEGALDLTFPRKRRVPAWALAACIAAIFVGMVSYAKLSGGWEGRIPTEVYRNLVPIAGRLGHP
jgi:polyferredoxin